MKTKNLLTAFEKAGKRVHMVGDAQGGVIAALDMEGRLFTTLGGEVLNRVNPAAIAGQSTREQYLNPGGDGLWPAPEGTMSGYQYPTGAWRVAPGLIAARYQVVEATPRSATIRAEVDLINSQGLGIPALFQRRIAIRAGRGSITVRVVESIVYIGRKTLRRTDCLLAPWTLCQFDSGPGCEVAFPCKRKAAVWDLYDVPSDDQRRWESGVCRTQTDGSARYQIGIDARTPWIEFRDPRRGLVVRRSAEPLRTGQSYVDIRDAAPDVSPSRRGVRYSIYSDTARFMEIEAAGGCPAIIPPNTELNVVVNTRFSRP